LDEVRHLMRLKHYSRHTERLYSEWIKPLVRFHQLHQRSDSFRQMRLHFASHRHLNASICWSTYGLGRPRYWLTDPAACGSVASSVAQRPLKNCTTTWNNRDGYAPIW